MAIEVQIRKKLGSFNLDVEFASDSRRIGILGASGCGKSMTLKSIAGIENPDQGKIQIDGNIFFDRGMNVKPQKRKIGYLFQNYALFPTMTVGANISAGLKGNKKENEEIVDRMISKFRLDGLKKRLPGELSGGQQQRVALARIMAYEPDVILLDEPFSALDSFLKDRLQQELIEMLEDYAGTVIMVSHSRDEIYRFSEELMIMDEGRIVCHGDTRGIFANPQWKEAARLTGCKNIVDAVRASDHMLKIPDWNVSLELDQTIPEDITAIGMRAHDFKPIWGEREKNCMPVKVESAAELPFEERYFLETEQEDHHETVCWFIQREQIEEVKKKGIPNYLKFPEEKLLLLK